MLRLHAYLRPMNPAASNHFIKFALGQFKRNTNSEGVTLVELLVAASLIPITVLLASQIFTSQVSSERSLLAAQSSENLRSRLSFLIESDISDGEEILNSSDGRCPALAGKIFSVRSPFLDSSGLLQYACITYAQSDGNLIRLGPPILRNGSLDFQADPLSQRVATGVTISNTVISSSNVSVNFDLTIPGFLGGTPRTFSLAYGSKNFRVGT